MDRPTPDELEEAGVIVHRPLRTVS